jgi:hypothetical protein
MNNMSKGKRAAGDPSTPRTKRWSAEESLRIVTAAASASLVEGELGIQLRPEGLDATDV